MYRPVPPFRWRRRFIGSNKRKRYILSKLFFSQNCSNNVILTGEIFGSEDVIKEAAWPSGDWASDMSRGQSVPCPALTARLELFLGSHKFNSLTALVNSQLFCLLSFAIFNLVLSHS